MRPNSLVALIEARVAACPTGEVWSYGRHRHRSDTYEDLWLRSAGIAGRLVETGLVPGRPVVLLLHDVVDFVPAFWACFRAGGMAVPLTSLAADLLPDRRDAALRAALSKLHRPIVLFDEAFAEIATTLRIDGADLLALSEDDEVPGSFADRDGAEPACLIPTSGSTGDVKLVALSERAILHRPMSVAMCSEADPSATLSLFPFDTISGLRVLFLTCHTWVHLPLPVFAVDRLSALDAVERHGATTLSLTNALASMLAAAAAQSGRVWDLGTLRRVLTGSDRIVPAVMRRLKDQLAVHGASAAAVSANYGTTETALLVTGADPLDERSGSSDDETVSLGKSAPGVALRIAGEDGDILGEDDVGEVQALCPSALFSGYWGEDETTRAGFTEDGWWRTGDLGSLRDGALRLHGRVKEIVNVNGRKQSLADIDAHLQAELGARVSAHSCAVHYPGEGSERLVVVFSTRDPSPDATEDAAARIRASIGRRFGIQPNPVAAASPDQIPLTSAGKIRRHELVRRVQTNAFATSEPRI